MLDVPGGFTAAVYIFIVKRYMPKSANSFNTRNMVASVMPKNAGASIIKCIGIMRRYGMKKSCP